MSKYSTRTVTDDGEFVPWLAAKGPLAYSPEKPPDRDYFFQYGWVLPQVINPCADRGRRRYFGAARRDDADQVFAFWANARAGKTQRLHLVAGRLTQDEVSAPLAVYLHKDPLRDRDYYMMIQHGSYQYVDRDSQPEMGAGIVYLYRGLQDVKAFRYPGCIRESVSASTWAGYLKTQAEILSDSAVSFNSIHDRTMRCETSWLNDHSGLSDSIARRNRLPIDEDRMSGLLWSTHLQCFTLERSIAEWKFGPNFIVGKTPLSNLRITTFFAGEAEARVIDPGKLVPVDAAGCEWELEKPLGNAGHDVAADELGGGFSG